MRLILAIAFLVAIQGLTVPGAASQQPSSWVREGSAYASVLIVSDPRATDAFKPNPKVVREMVRRAVTSYLDVPTEEAAWGKLIEPEETVGLKVYAAAGGLAGTRPAMVAAVVESLLKAGIAPNNIVIWDKDAMDLQEAGFTALGRRFGVRVEAARGAGYDEKHDYPSSFLGRLIYGDLRFGEKEENTGRRSFVTRLLTEEIDKVINVTPLLSHSTVEVVGNLYNLALGSVDNAIRFHNDASRLARAVPEIYAMRAIGDKVVLNIVDGLIAQYVGGENALLHYAEMVNEVRLSRDPVALDRLSMETMRRLRRENGLSEKAPHTRLYENAALLQLGVGDPGRILVERLKLPARASE